MTVVDTTAAGDAFNGAFAAVLAGQWQRGPAWDAASLGGAVRFANAAGALATTKRGAQESLPTRDEILGLLRRCGKDS